MLEWACSISDVTYLRFVWILCDMVGVSRVFYKVGPPRSKLWIVYLVILRLKPEVGINSDELRVHPSENKKINYRSWILGPKTHLRVSETVSQSSGRFRPGWGQQ